MIIREMTQDMDNKIMTRNIGNLTWGLSPCEIDELTARRQRAYGSLATSLRLVLTLLLVMVVGVRSVWGQTTVAYVVDGHYLAHCGKDVNLGSDVKQAVTAPTEFNPNTCLWEIDLPTGESQMRGYGTSSRNTGYYLVEGEDKNAAIAAGNFYSLSVKSGSGRLFQTTLTEPKAWPSKLVSSANGAHYLRYHADNGWILVQNDASAPYATSTAPTIKKATVTTYSSGTKLYIDCPDVIESEGATPTLRALNCAKAYTHTVFDGTENHYWWDNADHQETPTVTVKTTSNVTWSVADADLEYVSINATTGAITVKKQVADNITLTLSCSAKVGSSVLIKSKSITLRGEYYVVKAGTLFAVKSGTTLTSSNSFDAVNGVWTREVNGTGHAFGTKIGSDLYYISEGGKWTNGNPTDAVLTALSSLAGNVIVNNQRWMELWPMKSTRNNHITWNGTKWTLTKETDVYYTMAYPISSIEYIENAYVDGDDEITYIDTYLYSSGANFTTPYYQVYTFDESKHYWYDGSDHDVVPAKDGEGSGNYERSWSLTGDDGIEDYVEINTTTGVLTVKQLPTSGSIPFTISCDISYNAQHFIVKKQVMLKPKALKAPVISKTANNTFTIESRYAGVAIYYTTGVNDFYTEDPSTSSTRTLYEGEFSLGDNNTCIKAVAVETDGTVSKLASYNLLLFSDEKKVDKTKTVTVAPMVSSSDMNTPDHMTAYIVSRVTPLNNSVVLRKLEYIPQGVPVLLLDDANEEGLTSVTFTSKNENIEDVSSSEIAANQLKVSDGTVVVQDAQVYMYYQGEFVLTFGGTLKQGRFYLNNPNYTTTPSSSAPALQLVIENTTGIDEVRFKMEEVRNGYWYTLDGRRLNGHPTTKGIYISNGQKKVIK